MFNNLQHGFYQQHGKCPTVIQTRHVYYEVFVMSLLTAARILSCKSAKSRSGVLQTRTRNNQLVLGLVIWQAMSCKMILFRTILQGIVRLRMYEQCWQSMMESTCFFFLWGFVKDQIYRTPVCDLADLQERIYAAVNNVTPQMFHNTWVEVEYWLYISCPTQESYVEVYGA